ncbi:hypothetical protein [Microbulbifer variabilis]|uniref:hypothetical protein n=1 Tax=Microbulbifer variabilis TaxID=266805 RepID=UPI000366CC9E|nr:hypothetical protein [Microbulbifer variabilis]
MELFKDQCLAGTSKDKQGEKVPREILQGFVDSYKGKKQSINQQHELHLEQIGYVENLRLIESPNEEGEFNLIGDVSCDIDKLSTVVGGFSIFYLEKSHEASNDEDFSVYLPFPHYNDEGLIQELLENQSSSVGKWVKKAADPATTALIGSFLFFAFAPVWDDTYKNHLAPRLTVFLKSALKKLRSKNINTNLIQKIEVDGKFVQIVLIPNKDDEESCYTERKLINAMYEVHKHLKSDSNRADIDSVFMHFDREKDKFDLHRVEYSGGRVVNHAPNK